MVLSVIEAEVDYLPLPAPAPEQCSWPDKNKHGSTTTTVVAGLELTTLLNQSVKFFVDVVKILEVLSHDIFHITAKTK